MPLPMMTPKRYVLLVLAVVISLHYLLSSSSTYYGELASLTVLSEQLGLAQNSSSPLDAYDAKPILPEVPPAEIDPVEATSPAIPATIIPMTSPPLPVPLPRRANATFVMLCRNSDMYGAISSMQSLEARFNWKYKYPWVLLNEEPFTDAFKERVSALTNAPVSFGLIPREHWYQPDWIDEAKAAANRWRMTMQRIIYADSVSYRNMCRFNSGFFFRHELLQDYKYYWRVEPDVSFTCDINYDPFLYMQDHDKVYSWTISLYEWEPTIHTLWDAVKEFTETNPQYVAEDNAMAFLSDNGGASYNLCHYWSNFELGLLDLWRSEAYTKFFDHLEAKGGFYYERWGDAPIHSIAASLFARKDQVHFFSDIGYRHAPFEHCPEGEEFSRGNCACNPSDTFDHRQDSCLPRYRKLFV